MSEIAARVQVLPWLGAGLSYLHLSASNNEDYAPFELNAFEISAAWRPVVNRWFDPFLQAGMVGVIGWGGGYPRFDASSRFGLEAMVGFDFVATAVRFPLAVGLHARSGFTNESWTMVGLHLELRI